MPATTDPSVRQLDPQAVEHRVRQLAQKGEVPWLHAEVARRMAERLPVIRLQPDTVIEWWPGLGGGSELLARAYPESRRILVEPSSEWLAVSRQRRRTPWWSASRWTSPPVDEALHNIEHPACAQMVWSNMGLHAVADPPTLMANWHRLLAPGGVAMFSCLGPDTLLELRRLYGSLGWPPPSIDFVDMHDLGDMLLQAGFAEPVMDQERLTLTWDSPAAVIRELRQLGGNVHPLRFAGLRTPRWRGRLERALDGLRRDDGRLHLGFEISYGHAFRVSDRASPAGETRVSLDEMRALVRGDVREP